MIVQLNPMIPIYRISDNMEGYAFLVIDYSQEHNLLFTCAMDNGEIWTLNNKEIRFCKNISLDSIRKLFISQKLTLKRDEKGNSIPIVYPDGSDYSKRTVGTKSKQIALPVCIAYINNTANINGETINIAKTIDSNNPIRHERI